MSESNRERDLVLAPNEFAFISDQTKGNINVYVGPYKTSLANTDKPVIFDPHSKRFDKCSLDESIQTFTIAPEGWYVVMKNPAQDNKQPKIGTSNSLAELNVGRKVNIPGPISFALWPGQMTQVIRGHHLRSNQYLLVRIYDEGEARKNWGKAVIKVKSDEGEGVPTEEKLDLTMGKTLVIKGETVSFYIPPTGVEVVPDEYGSYIREAVTLEQLEYCVLLNEDGNKRYIKGPAVVFPEPTEEFMVQEGFRKFRAIELNEISGIYIKVIAPYEENGKSYKMGDELFITGKDQMIYYPRPEHAIIKYDKREKHHAIAIPAGEGRYYLNRNTGTIALQKGPAMFLPDPREVVVVRRILDPKQVQLWFPGNKEALDYNLRLKALLQHQQGDFIADDHAKDSALEEEAPLSRAKMAAPKEKASESTASDAFDRKSQHTPPRSIVLNNKYEGAVTIDLWTGYAVLVVSKTGTRKVIAGPQSYLLEYDESLEAISLSTGTPKSEDNLVKTVYLRVLYNKISDLVKAESADFTQVSLRLSYRVNFEGDPEKWFNVENYVKFLTDHMRSYIRHVVKRHSIMDFYANGVTLLRDAILGIQNEEGKRPGRIFAENGMRIYDVEVLDIVLGDNAIEKLLIASQQEVVKQTLSVAAEKRKLQFVEESEAINQKIADIQSQSKRQSLDLEVLLAQKQLELNLAKLASEIEARNRQLQAQLADQEVLGKIQDAEISREKQEQEMLLALAQQDLEQEIARMKAEVDAVVAKAQAVSPDLIAALQSFADNALAERVAQSMSPLAILGGNSVADVFNNLLKGTKLANVLAQALPMDLDGGEE